MKSIILISILVAVALAAPQDAEVRVLKSESENDGLGHYRFAYELSDGTKREEQGELLNPEAEDGGDLEVQGSYIWPAPDGSVWQVTFHAGKNGFQPKVERIA